MKKFIVFILTWQAKWFIAKNKPVIIGVAGSIGKTSTTQAIATILRQCFRVRATIKSYNTDIGVPCTIFQKPLPQNLNNPLAWIRIIASNQVSLFRRTNVEVLVLELGTDRPGDLAIFTWLPVDTCVITAVADEHMEFFGTLDAVAEEEMSVASFSKKLLLNKRMINEEYYAGIDPKRTAFYDRDDLSQFGLTLDELRVIAPHSSDAVVAGLNIGRQLGMNDNELKKGAQAVEPQAGRMTKLTGVNNSILIDDTYNASPKAYFAALDYLYSINSPQKIVLLGNMNELGESSPELHRQVGAYCDPKQIVLVVTLGPDANQYAAAAAREAGCTVQETTSPYQAAEIIKATLTNSGACVLLKGSQNKVFAEEAVKMLLANPEDVSKIVRQSPFWMAKKKACFGDVVR